jgi:hypothetical protein
VYQYLSQAMHPTDNQDSGLDLAPGVTLRGLTALLPSSTPRHLLLHVEGAAAGAAAALGALRSHLHALTHSLLPALEASAADSGDLPAPAPPSCMSGLGPGECKEAQEARAVAMGHSVMMMPHGPGRQLTAAGLTRALLTGRVLLQAGGSGCGSSAVTPTITGSSTAPGALLSASQPAAKCTGAAVSTQVGFCTSWLQ